MVVALTRAVSESLARCELTFRERSPIDVETARRQHDGYIRTLQSRGLSVLRLPAEDALPDAVFVEDPALVLEEMAVALRPGASSRQPEVDSLVPVLERFRPLVRITPPGTLDGGDVVRIGRDLFVGMSKRSNPEGIRQLAELTRAFGYTVTPVRMDGCLHLKSGCTSLGDRVLLNPAWVDAGAFARFAPLSVPAAEPGGADVLALADCIVTAASFPATAELLESEGYEVVMVDVSEFEKAEAGVTCLSLVFDAPAVPPDLLALRVGSSAN